MNAREVQEAVANLIRFPEKSLDEILAGRQVDHSQLAILQTMAGDPLVRKFGAKMRYLRLRDAIQCLPLTRRYLGAAEVERLYCECFDPSRPSIDFTEAGKEFAEFLLSSDVCKSSRDSWPAYLSDIVLYELRKETILHEAIVPSDSRLPQGSLLAHRAFFTISLNFDIATIDKVIHDDPTSQPIPDQRKNELLFLRCFYHPYFQVYEIDQSICEFLDCQLKQPLLWQAPLPEAYSAMVDEGLCRSV